MFTQGLIESGDDTRLSEKWLLKKINEIKEKSHSDDFCYAVNQYAEQWLELTKRIKRIDSRLAIQAESEKGLQMIYESVPVKTHHRVPK